MKEMIPAHELVGDRRYREKYGMAYEEFEVGDVFEHRPGRTMTEIDNIWGSLVTMNKHPAHIDSAYAERTEFGKLLMNSAVTLSVVSGMTVASMSAKATANLGWDEIRLPNPVFVGDTLYAESEVVEKRESRSRPHEGIVTIKVTGRKQDSSVVITYRRTFLVPKKAYCSHYEI